MTLFYECLKFMGNKPIFNPPHVGDLMKDSKDVHKNLNIKNAFDHKKTIERKKNVDMDHKIHHLLMNIR